MPDEKPDYERTIVQLAGEVAALREIVASIIINLPERAMHNVAAGIRGHLCDLDHQVRETQNDNWRDYAAAAHNLAAPLEDAISMWIDDLIEGSRLRTIQPYPIDPIDQVDRQRGY